MILGKAKANRAKFGAIACVFALLTILVVPSSQAFADDSFESRVDALKAQADAGDPGSEFVLGSLFRQTLPDHPPDFRIAVEWFEKAAKQGNAMAAEMAGMTYQVGGFGLERNLGEGPFLVSEGGQRRKTRGPIELGLHGISRRRRPDRLTRCAEMGEGEPLISRTKCTDGWGSNYCRRLDP